MTGTKRGRLAPRSVAATAARGALRLGTRRSALATTQSGWVADQVSALAGREVTMVEIVTPGDVSSAPIASLGSTGVFVTALRDALLRDEVDLVVHSYKDLPAAAMPGLRLAAVPVRQDARDALIDRAGRSLLELPAGTRVGTGSARRALELRRLGLPVTVVAMRGNVDTRLRKLADGNVDALILAAAGLIRLGRREVITELIDPALMLPAPAQGALAVECRADDAELGEILATLDDAESRITAEAERSFLAALDAGCTAPVGAHARLTAGPTPAGGTRLAAGATPAGGTSLAGGSILSLDVLASGQDGAALRATGRAPVEQGVWLGRELAVAMLRGRGIDQMSLDPGDSGQMGAGQLNAGQMGAGQMGAGQKGVGR